MVVRAVDGVDLVVERGDYVAVMGASGSGKSTLMNIIGCLDVPTCGRYLLDGVDSRRLDERRQALVRNRKIGFIFQSFNLIPRTTAREQRRAADGLRGGPRGASAGSGRSRALEQVGLGEPGRTTCRRSCPAASSSAWRSPARSPRTRCCCSPTSRPARWTATAPTTCCALFDDLNADGPHDHRDHPRGGGGAPRQAGGADAGRADRVRPAGRRAGGRRRAATGCDAGTAGGLREPRGRARGSPSAGCSSNKLRSLLTMSGILIGVAAVIILVAAGNGASAPSRTRSAALGSNTLTVTPSPGAATGGRRRGRGLAAGAAVAAARGARAARRGGGRRRAGGGRRRRAGGTSAVDNGTQTRGARAHPRRRAGARRPGQAPDVVSVAPVVDAQSVDGDLRRAPRTPSARFTGTTPSYLINDNDTVAAGAPFTDADYTAHRRVALLGTTVATALVGGDGTRGRRADGAVQRGGVHGGRRSSPRRAAPARRTRTTGSSPR